MVLLKSSKNKDAARKFLEFVRGAAAAKYCCATDLRFRRRRKHAWRPRANSSDMDALLLSLRLAAWVSAILLIVGLPLAYWLAFWNWRGKFLFEAVVALPLVLPPTVLGFFMLVVLGPRGPLGKYRKRYFTGVWRLRLRDWCLPRCCTTCRLRCSR